MPYDVVILGGGLAGQTLARQLVRARPALRVLILEKHAFPVREAAFKVGESTVELSARYFRDVLGLKDHLDADQLPKLGLRYFFPAGRNDDITPRVEVGAIKFPPTAAYQLDRGRLENFLAAGNAAMGVDVLDGCTVRRVQLGTSSATPPHTVTFERAGQSSDVTGRWVVDAAGRAGILRRQLGLGRPVGHDANACWFRIAERLAVDDWSDSPAWRARVPSGERWLSTNHLMGRGYWVWLIPLASGSTSVGIVVDARLHSFARLSRFDAARAWLAEYEPQCAAVIESKRHLLQDFLALQRYAYGCTQVLSADRWALTGEAGLFTDPFYSPGSDFIALANTFITDLIMRDLDGEDIAIRAARFDQTYLVLFEAFIQLFEGQYPLMGNAQVMTAKVLWDNATYWAFTALLFFHGKYTDLEFMDEVLPLSRRFVLLHRRMQDFLRRWDEADRRSWGSAHIDLLHIDFMYALQSGLSEPLADGQLLRKLRENMELLEALASAIERLAPGGVVTGRRAVFAEPETAIARKVAHELEAIRLEQLATGSSSDRLEAAQRADQ